MATITTSTYYQYRKQQGYLDMASDTLKAVLMDVDFSHDRDKHKAMEAPEWSADTYYSEGDTVIPANSADLGYIMICIDHGSGVEGQSGSSEPNWPVNETDPFGNTVADGDLIWEVWSYDASLEEITSAGGYVRQTLTQDETGAGSFEDEVNNSAYQAYDDLRFEADSEGFDEVNGCIIYDESDPQKTIIAGVQFDSSFTISGGNYLELKDPKVEDISKQTTIE